MLKRVWITTGFLLQLLLLIVYNEFHLQILIILTYIIPVVVVYSTVQIWVYVICYLIKTSQPFFITQCRGSLREMEFPACADLAVWLWRRERRVLLLHALLLGLLALGQVLVAERGQKSLPALNPQVRVFGQLPLDHERLMMPNKPIRKEGTRSEWMTKWDTLLFMHCHTECLVCSFIHWLSLQKYTGASFMPSAPGRASLGVQTQRDLFQSRHQEQGWKISSLGMNAACASGTSTAAVAERLWAAVSPSAAWTYLDVVDGVDVLHGVHHHFANLNKGENYYLNASTSSFLWVMCYSDFNIKVQCRLSGRFNRSVDWLPPGVTAGFSPPSGRCKAPGPTPCCPAPSHSRWLTALMPGGKKQESQVNSID